MAGTPKIKLPASSFTVILDGGGRQRFEYSEDREKKRLPILVNGHQVFRYGALIAAGGELVGYGNVDVYDAELKPKFFGQTFIGTGTAGILALSPKDSYSVRTTLTIEHLVPKGDEK